MTNLSERDIADYDIGFWARQWHETRIQGLIANGVAKFATFPSQHPLVPASRFAPDRDLLGEIAVEAHRQDLVLAVRMDSVAVPEPVLETFTDWRARTPDGEMLPQMCINSPYRREFAYGLYREIIGRYGVDGFTDNGGIGVGTLCHCSYCAARWQSEVGGRLPTTADMNDPAYRTWTRWNEEVVMSNWGDTQAFLFTEGGPHCLFLGLARKFSPLNRTLAKRAHLVMMDCQSRNDSGTFSEHVDEGRYLRRVLGPGKNVAVSSSMTHHSHGYFRITSDPVQEARMFLLSGIAGGLDPWWHHPTAYSPDRRSYRIAEGIFGWHSDNVDVLSDRIAVAQVGLVRSDRNDQFFGRDTAAFIQPERMGEVTQATYRGAAQLLFDSRISFVPVNILDIATGDFDEPVLFLPNVGGLSDGDCEVLRSYVSRGGGLVATGHTSLFDEWGEPRDEFGLADVFGVKLARPVADRRELIEADTDCTLEVDIAKLSTFGVPPSAVPSPSRYGGGAVPIQVDADRVVVARVAPAGEAAAVVGTYGKGRVAYLPIDVDRRHLREPEPASAELVAQLVRWSGGAPAPVEWESDGRVGAYLYRQGVTRILHLLNFSGDNGDSMMDGPVPSGPVTVRLHGLDSPAVTVQSRVREDERLLTVTDGHVSWSVDSLDEHDLFVIRPTA